MMHHLLSVCTLTLALVGWTDASPERACNNSPELCSKPYDTITHLGAHDSPFLRDESTQFSSFGNQHFNTTIQLDAGVRLLSAQVHIDSNAQTGVRELHVCHTSCALFDAGPLRDWLLEIRTWMDANPNDVVTLLLVNFDNVDAKEIEGVYSEADIAHYAYVAPDIDKAPGASNETHQTWPTLATMIERGERLVTFVNGLEPDAQNAPYLLNEFTFIWENAYEVTSPEQFACTPDRPTNQTTAAEMVQSGRLFLMNHFLYWQQAFGIQVPDIRFLNTTNAWEGPGALGEHIVRCASEVMRQPTFVLVDFFDVGPAVESVDIFNHVSQPVGRLDVTEKAREFDAEHRSGSGRMKLLCKGLLAAVTIAGLVWNAFAL
jgi:hypothetical protein